MFHTADDCLLHAMAFRMEFLLYLTEIDLAWLTQHCNSTTELAANTTEIFINIIQSLLTNSLITNPNNKQSLKKFNLMVTFV